jgi:hypothetical protein
MVAADLLFLEAPNRALAHAVHRPVRVCLAPVGALRPAGIVIAAVVTQGTGHGVYSSSVMSFRSTSMINV